MPVTINGTTGFTFPNGSAGTPSLTGVDTDTGIFFGTDTVSLTTAATRRLVVTSTGVIGIGATSVIQQGSGIDGGVAAGILELYNGSTGHTTLTNTGAYDIIFQTNNTPRLRINSSGNVGIGTFDGSSSILSRVQIVTGSSAAADSGNMFTISSDSGNLVEKLNMGVNTSGYAWIQATKPGTDVRPLILQPSGGNVGIGTTNPISKLHVEGTFRSTLSSGAGGDTLLSGINGVSNGYIISVDASNNITYKWHTGNNTQAMTISSSGNTGIGTTNPRAKLDVNGYVYGTYGGNYFAGRKYANYITATASGNNWLRIAYVTGRTPIRVTINTTGNWYSPGATIFTCLRGWNTNDFYVTGIEKLAAQYTSQVRMQSDINGGDYFIEILFSVSPNQLESACHVTVECLGSLQGYGQYVSSYGTNAANLTYTSSAIVL